MTKRVLVVEDIPENRSTYKLILSRDGHSVDVAESKKDALDLISKRSYHVALVDLRLIEHDESNFEGLDILDAFHNSQEGTALIVLSGHPTDGSLKKAYEKYRIRSYFPKNDAPPAAIRAAVNEAMESVGLAELGKWSSLSQLLTGGGNNQLIWEGKCLSILNPGGISGFYGLLTDVFYDVLPVLPKREGDTAKINETARSLELSLWSKGHGTAVYAELRRGAGGNGPPGLGKCLNTFGRHGVACAIWEDPRNRREDFVESIWR
jgi:CheY-like chemotaxis protein